MKRTFLISTLILFSLSLCFSQAKMPEKAKIKHIKNDFSIDELDNKTWKKAEKVKITKYWSGENAPNGRQFWAKLLWSDSAIYVRFEANTGEPIIMSEKPNVLTKTRGLWDRDVCEIFLAPKREDFRHYFEFEIAPNGEWIDLGIYQKPDERITDWDYNSGMKSAARIERDKVIMAIKVDWKAFGATPKAGDVWLGNILRAMGSEPNRGYLTWSPTMTKEANFHVPEKFGEFEFMK
jgi:hypothetical protein